MLKNTAGQCYGYRSRRNITGYWHWLVGRYGELWRSQFHIDPQTLHYRIDSEQLMYSGSCRHLIRIFSAAFGQEGLVAIEL